MTTIVAKKAEAKRAIATDDEAHEQLLADTSLPEYAEMHNYGNTTVNNTFNNSITEAAAPILTGAMATNAMSNATVLVANTNEHWINNKWRPAMGWVYMVTCITDFILFPILWSILQAVSKGQVTSQWQPLTLQGAGLFHMAMGTILGITAYGRTKEKVKGKN